MATKDGTDLLKQAFALLAERGWRRFSFAELARRTGVGLAEVYAELPGRPALLRALGRRLDREMLQIDLAELDGMTPRERMFELIMRRLDAMVPYKEGLRVLARASRRQPDVLLTACCNLDRLSRRLLDAAAGERPLVFGRLARRAAQLVYLCTLRVWLDDDSPDMARTLAELDRRLQQAETAARWLGGSGRARDEAAPA
ncbi:MAG: TetR family transcriptional regulator [Geminicoccaceae bacterium]